MPEKKTIIEYDNIRYRIRVCAGPNLKSLRPVHVNDDANPFFIESDEFVGHLTYRIRGQDQIHGYEQGQKQDGMKVLPNSPWFQNAAAAGKGSNLLNSLHIIGRFKREWSGDQVVMAVVFDKPLNLPSITSFAVKMFKAIDPGLQVDLQCPEPYFISPFLSCMDTVNVSLDPSGSTLPIWPNAESTVEDSTLIISEEDSKKKAKIGKDVKARKNHFAKAKNLEKHKFVKNHVYGVELFNPYMDCSKFAVRLPGGFNVELFKILNEQPISYVFRSKDGSTSFLAISIELVPVIEDLSNI